MEPNRESWIVQVGEWTRAARNARADHHDAVAAHRFSVGDDVGGKWHEGRARGQRERIERVIDCATQSKDLACYGCGTVDEPQPEYCDGWRYCVPCRGRRIARERARLTQGMAKQRELYRHYIQHGSWRERFLTLTVPHGASVSADIDTLMRSWARMRAKLRGTIRHLPGPGRWAKPGLPYYRALEVAGNDHAHLHAWVMSPYLHHVTLRALWGKSLRWKDATQCNDEGDGSYVPVRHIDAVLSEYGKTALDIRDIKRAARHGRKRLQWLPWPVLDIRVVRGDSVNEIVKYLTKDVRFADDGSPTSVDPFAFANIIEATEGRRVCGGCWYLTDAKETTPCELCGCALVVRLDDRFKRSASSCRGPPAYVHT